jgi:two-component system NtrC family sensor kinase
MKDLYDRFASTWLGSMFLGSAESRYVRFARNLLFIILVVAIAPFLIQGVVAHYQAKKLIERQYKEHLVWQLRHTQESVDQFLEVHMAALLSLFQSHAVQAFADQKSLQHVFLEFKKAFPNFVDLGLIDSNGLQKTYDGPYKLLEKNYRDESWFHEAVIRGVYISDVFLGYRQIPHLVMAVKSPPSDTGEFWVLRTTINTEPFDKMVGAMNYSHEDDTFLVNKDGSLQNRSRFHGNALNRLSMSIPCGAQGVTWTEGINGQNQQATIAYIGLRKKDWTLAFVQPLSVKEQHFYALQQSMTLVSMASFIGVVLLALWMTKRFVMRLREAEEEHDAMLHKIEHSNKLASIGRLASGVAHEINNPMAIINEKAGLMKDLTEMSDDFANKERFLDLLRSIHGAVIRCRTITHRLLGFARQMHVSPEVVDINELIREVLSFLEKEAFHRDIRVELELEEDLPTVVSDRGQLQQVFLNVINNAMDAVDKGGEIRVGTWIKDEEMLAVKISDTGCGIAPDKLKRICEPFYTTKRMGKGTGLGLSITYGIIDKLGGKVTVESEINKGTTFVIEIPRESRL